MTEQAKTETTQAQLVVIEPTTAVALFTEGQGVAELLADIRQKATSLVPDITTAKGRKEIASVAHAAARTKTYLDGLGKELTDQYKEIPKRIDANRKGPCATPGHLERRGARPASPSTKRQRSPGGSTANPDWPASNWDPLPASRSPPPTCRSCCGRSSRTPWTTPGKSCCPGDRRQRAGNQAPRQALAARQK